MIALNENYIYIYIYIYVCVCVCVCVCGNAYICNKNDSLSATNKKTDWLFNFNGISTLLELFYLVVTESGSFYDHIYIFVSKKSQEKKKPRKANKK